MQQHLDFINEKVVDGRRYRAMRDPDQPQLQYVVDVASGQLAQCTEGLDKVWNDRQLLKDIFNAG